MVLGEGLNYDGAAGGNFCVLRGSYRLDYYSSAIHHSHVQVVAVHEGHSHQRRGIGRASQDEPGLTIPKHRDTEYVKGLFAAVG